MKIFRHFMRKDIAFAVLMFAIIIVMIIPINRTLMDMLIALNFTLSIVIFMTSIYIRSPLSFVTFPSVILVATSLRIGLSVATTRLILTKADAGDIIDAFGKFAVSSNAVVGMIIFLIITIIQFIVITKGAERIAEVSARFKLDALPGQQMSIEADGKAGDMTRDEVRIKRAMLSEESQFFGSMDGAMKFVKGDAIAGLIITMINLMGGILVGVGQLGMSFGEAVGTFSLLTVGDGLVAQIPALFIALSAGTIVTRAKKEGSTDLGSDIVGDLLGEPQALYVAAGTIFTMGLIPGFPTVIFTLFAIALLAASRFISRQQQTAERVDNDLRIARTPTAARESSDRYAIACGARLFGQIDIDRFLARRTMQAERYLEKLGVDMTFFGIDADPRLAPDRWELRRDGVPVLLGTIPENSLLAAGDRNVILLMTEDTPEELAMPHRPLFVLPVSYAQALRDAEMDVFDPAEALADIGCFQIELTGGIMFGQLDLEIYLAQLSKRERLYLNNILDNMDRRKIAEIIGFLLVEGVPVIPREAFLDSLSFLADEEGESSQIAQNMRYLLRRQMCKTLADEDNIIGVHIVDREIDMMARGALPDPETGEAVPISVDRMRPVLKTLRKSIEHNADTGHYPAIVASNEARGVLHGFFVKHKVYLKVLAQRELAEEFTFEPLGLLRAAPVHRDEE